MSSGTAPTSKPMRAIILRVSSSCSELRFCGSRPMMRAVLITIDVPMCPGITSDTFTCGAFRRQSLTSAPVKPFTANFAALYAVCAVCGPGATPRSRSRCWY